MKIDIEGLLQTKGGIDSSSGIKQTLKRDGAAPTASMQNPVSTIQNVSNAKALIDAMVISQIAQNLINRAIEISSKLRDIARNAVASGKINNKELEIALSDTKSSFNKLQEPFSAPVISESTANFTNISKEHNINIELPQLKKETALLKEFEAGLSNGKKPDNNDIEKIDIILNNLQNGNQLIDKLYHQIEKSFEIIGGHNKNYVDIILNTSNRITNKPDIALISQGNIKPETAKILLDTQLI
jgi:hypothetical protein